MSEDAGYRKYGPLKIPGRPDDRGTERAEEPRNAPAGDGEPLSDGMFYEIEYGSHPIPGVGRFVRKPLQIAKPASPDGRPERDEIRALFDRMRDIARAYRAVHDFSRFFDRRVRLDSAAIFYRQGMFMKDFTDDYPEKVPFSQYYPFYQMMGYRQLRTYFTWRAKVREGNVEDTSLSYAFLYIYELLNNIGVNDPQEGLEKLMFFWKAFRAFNNTVDKYVLKWLKDYHIYYELPHSFNEFVRKNDLSRHYPKTVDTDDNFDLFCAVSKYDIRKSAFFTGENKDLITGCFYFVTDRLRRTLSENGIRFDESVFQPARKMTAWTPFKGALFHDWLRQPDRRIVLSESEIYVCSQNRWAFSSVITSEGGRQLIGYIMKQMESVLRKITKYKYKISAKIETVTHPLLGDMQAAGLSIKNLINEAVREYYREATKIVVKVDIGNLSQIRREALIIQERLTVEERDVRAEPIGQRLVERAGHAESIGQAGPVGTGKQSEQDLQPYPMMGPRNFSFTVPQDIPPENMSFENVPVSPDDAWESLKDALTKTEKKALNVILRGERSIKDFADECGMMLEVLVDGINEKAMDFIGDSLLGDEFEIYEEYKDHVKEMVG